MPTDLTSPELARWRELATAAAKGRPPERLVQRIADGVSVAPLYVDRPASALQSSPIGRLGAWEARVALAPTAPTAWLHEVARRGGVPAVSLDSLDAPEIARLLSAGPVALDAGSNLAGVADADRHPQVRIYADPLGVLAACGGLERSLSSVLDAVAAGRRDGAVRLAPSGVWAAEAGAEAPLSLAVALASGVALLRALHERGVPSELAARDLELRVPLGGQVLLDLAMVRAARRVLGRLLVAGGVDPRAASIAAVLPATELSGVDPSTNLLRASIAGFAGAAGGADAVVLPAHDAATGAPGLAGVKLAANLHLLLSAEAMLGRVQDPTAGSYAVEHLTDALARAAWTELQRIEGEGGLVASLRAGACQTRIREGAALRADRVARRLDAWIGVSSFADATAPLPPPAVPTPAPTPAHDVVDACPAVRPSAPWESLRRRLSAHPVTVTLVPIGPLKHHQARLDFTRDLLLSAGFLVHELAPQADPDQVAVAFATAGAPIACLCGSDSDYERVVPALAGPLVAAGARAVVVAGRWPEPPDAWRAAGVDHVVHLGADVLATCVALADRTSPEAR